MLAIAYVWRGHVKRVTLIVMAARHGRAWKITHDEWLTWKMYAAGCNCCRNKRGHWCSMSWWRMNCMMWSCMQLHKTVVHKHSTCTRVCMIIVSRATIDTTLQCHHMQKSWFLLMHITKCVCYNNAVCSAMHQNVKDLLLLHWWLLKASSLIFPVQGKVYYKHAPYRGYKTGLNCTW